MLEELIVTRSFKGRTYIALKIIYCEAVKNAKIHVIMTFYNLLESFLEQKRDT